MINQGMCERHHDLAKVECEKGGKPGISLFNAEPRELPYKLEMMERHPKGSQAFIPMHAQPFLVIVAIDDEGIPARPNAFITEPHIGINFHRNICIYTHSVPTLTPNGRLKVIASSSFGHLVI